MFRRTLRIATLLFVLENLDQSSEPMAVYLGDGRLKGIRRPSCPSEHCTKHRGKQGGRMGDEGEGAAFL